MPSTESQTIDRNGDQQQLDSVQCSPVAHLEDEISESPIIEEHSRNRKDVSLAWINNTQSVSDKDGLLKGDSIRGNENEIVSPIEC